jgi:glycosyltransferase involved in cell wall biosynthesis
MTATKLAVVVSGFPRTSETFAVNELAALEERGLLAGIFATKPGDGSAASPGCDRLLPWVSHLPDGTADDQAAALASRLAGTGATAIHAYFAHRPAEVAAEAAARLGLPFGFSTHARDSRKTSADDLAARCARARCVVACNHDVAADIHRAGGWTHVVPHGVDLEAFPSAPPAPPGRLRLLAVGRLVPKKGFDVLIEAVADLRVPFSLRIVGDGPERRALEARAHAHGLGRHVVFAGAATQGRLALEYADAHVVVVPSVVDATGDRDGLPNVILEAMSTARAVVATNVGAIQTAVVHGETGVVVPPGSPAALADALQDFAHRPGWCIALGQRGRHRVEQHFDLRHCADSFVQLLEAAYA